MSVEPCCAGLRLAACKPALISPEEPPLAIEPAVELRSVVPILPVADIGTAVDWYRRVLGFELAWKWGDPTQIACVCRGPVELMLERHAGDPRPGIARLYLQVGGIGQYYRQIVAAGANVTHPLAAREYGMKDCRVVDPDGNELSFGEPAG